MSILGNRAAMIGALALTLAGSIRAHDFWIEADPFTAVTAPQPISVTLRVGIDMVGETVPNIADWYRDFSFVHNGRREPVSGNMGDDPAGSIAAKAPGAYIVGYENRPDFIELRPDKFDAYLREEGLEKIIDQRHALGEADQPAREFYQRCVKSLVRVGDQAIAPAQLRHAFGYQLEIVPHNSPWSGEPFEVQVLFQGAPVAGLLVSAFTQQHPQRRSRQRTDASGRVRIDLADPGTWIVKVVEMRRDPVDSTAWRSYWASLTFARR